ncbi:ATP-binding cassette domain-containing protein [Chloroflexota bacterium]
MDNGLVIETKDLTKTFGDFTAVDGIDLAVHKGTIHGFVGPNGAGKTTTMKMLIGALRSTRGWGRIKGHEIGSSPARQLIGYSPEQPFFYKDMLASDYLVYMARVCGTKRAEARRKALGLLDWLDMAGFSESKVGTFSAGMKQRLGLAQALIHEPEVLILDESTANMDPTGRLSILDKLRQLSRENGATIFLSSHILAELEQVVDFMTMIDRGRIVVHGEMAELRQRFSGNHFLLKTSHNVAMLEALRNKGLFREGWIDTEDFVHLVSDDRSALRREVVEAAVQNGAELEHFSEERASLQDIYRKTMGMEEEG